MLACSGRDDHFRGVLNDEWVSHPTWASEESGFVAHKKNTYEEALHKSEEERHEFQFYIDIITRTIALLQPINDRIVEMSAEERHVFRLPVDFGGSSKSIYHRAIKKVYGRDAAGMEILQALQDCPGIAIPVILPRLKQKNEEWRKAQREWNRVWREVDARNFYKSLDHQGITFKANDKKHITTKSLVSEIEHAKAEAVERAVKAKAAKRKRDNGRANSDDNDKRSSSHSSVSSSPSSTGSHSSTCHLELVFEDFAVLQDALKLVFSFLDRSPVQYSALERRGVERTLRTFIPLFCMFTTGEFDAAFGAPLEPYNDEADEANDDSVLAGGLASAEEGDDMHGQGSHERKSSRSSGRRSAGGSGSVSASGGASGGVDSSDLRKKLLKTQQEAKTRSGSASGSRAVSPVGSEDGHEGGGGVGQASGSRTPQKKKKSRKAKSSGDGAAHWDVEEWIKLMPVEYDVMQVNGTGGDDRMDADGVMDEDPIVKLGKYGIVNQKPFFMNTTFYALLRLLHVCLCFFL